MTTYLLASIVIGTAAAYVTATIVAAQIARAGFLIPVTGRRIGCIDGLRGYLAISVLAHHFIILIQVTRMNSAWEAPPINLFNQLGAGGVALFFMTTGLVFYPRVLKGFLECSFIAIDTIITLVIVARTGRGLDREFPIAALKWVATWISAMKEPPLLNYPDSGRLNAYVLWSLSYEWIVIAHLGNHWRVRARPSV